MSDKDGMFEGDAKFEDGGENPLRLIAQNPEDVFVVATMVQDAVAQTSEMSYSPKKRRFMALLNRFRWEDHQAAEKSGRPFERVQSILMIESVLRPLKQDIDPADKELVLSLIGLSFVAGEDGAGRVVLTFSGDGALAFDVEAIDISLKDVSRPYVARASRAPGHDLSE